MTAYAYGRSPAAIKAQRDRENAAHVLAQAKAEAQRLIEDTKRDIALILGQAQAEANTTLLDAGRLHTQARAHANRARAAKNPAGHYQSATEILAAAHTIWANLRARSTEPPGTGRARLATLGHEASQTPHISHDTSSERKGISHGTRAGYKLHRRLRTPACAECLAAEAEYSRELRALHRARKDAA